MQKSLKVLGPKMPNFYRTEQNGKDAGSFPVEDLTATEAIEFAEMMKEQFIEHWQNKAGQTIDPELIQPVEERNMAKLWGLLEDVETLAATLEPKKAKDYKLFYEKSVAAVRRRNEFGTMVNGVVIFPPF